MNIDQEGVAGILQSKEKIRTTAIARIGSDPAKAHSVATGLLNDFQRQLVFGFKDLFAFRDARFVASLLIIAPFFGQVEPRINGRGKTSLGQNPEDCHLSIIDLTQSPEILTTGADRHLALFGKPTLVDNERGVRCIPDQLIGIACHMIEHFTSAPFRVSDKLLQISFVGVRHYL